ncbi:MAG: peptide chain release factor 2 [Chloroflexaceae bacterium]|nr:peptide chain release factor 2 [Chloroflexaceae bacterium]
MRDLASDLETLYTRFESIRRHLDLETSYQEIAHLEERAADPDLWNNPKEAQGILQRLARVKEATEAWDRLDAQLTNLAELIELAVAEEDESLREEMQAEMATLEAEMARREVTLLLNGRYDDRDAFVSIQAGMGGTDAQDWAEMMLRMYVRWAEARSYQASIVDISPGDEAGLKSATLEIRGPYAYGHARAETGVHRLIRLSPFNSAHIRQTSFARVEVMPEVDDAPEVVINPDDLRIDVFRSTGHGGQGVNTTDSAVRLTHLPTGMVVTCQNERSQLQNKETALRVLRGRLLERELQRQNEERQKLRGEYRQADFGNQMRTYYLHPYTLVKDHRTNEETSDVWAVLDGRLDPFIESFLRWNLSHG